MKTIIIRAIEKATGIDDVKIEKPEIEEHGDYSSNIAMQMFSRVKRPRSRASTLRGKQEGKEIPQKVRSPHLAKSKRDDKADFNSLSALSKYKTPHDLANEIVKKLAVDPSLKAVVDRIEVAGPGFINFWLSNKYLQANLHKIAKQADKYGTKDIGRSQTVLIEYSSPNIARRFGIGHLRSTIIGQALYNTYKHLGYKTVGENHLGDWGTQFGMIIAAVDKKDLDYQKLSVEDFQKLYVDFNKACQDDPGLREEAKKSFKNLEDGKSKAKDIWKIALQNSKKEFDRLYDILGVKIDNAHGESFYEDKMPSVVTELKKKGLTKRSQGAEIVEFPSISSGKAMTPAILIKSDGGTTYFTRDLAALKYRLSNWSPKKLIYEVGVEQTLHFKQVFEAARLAGWVKKEELVHIPHGHYRFKGKKISTRKGADIILEEILNEAQAKAKDILEKTKTAKDLSKKEKQEISKSVGIGAIKYFDLSHQPKSDIDFDWEGMFNMQGNSGPYLQYTYARTQSVMRKSKRAGEWKSKSDLKPNKEEVALMRAFIHFSEVVEKVAENYSPNLLCNYLFDLAQKYNGFYNNHRILDVENKELKNLRAKERKNKQITNHQSLITQDFRLALTRATGQILKNGLGILGIEAPDKM